MARGGGPVLIMAGGTGGHVFPALAVAEALRRRGVPVAWMGARGGLEARVAAGAGIPFRALHVTGLRGRGPGAWLSAPLWLGWALLEAAFAVLRLWPRAVLGMGGFAAGPGGLAAWLLRRPLIVHEQNAVPGLTNRLLAPLADVVLQGFPGALRGARTTGNPVRREIAALPPPAERFAGRRGPARVLVLGGSRGARFLNETVPAALAGLPAALRPEVWHQCGVADQAAVEARYREAGLPARVSAFIEDMAQAYAWADLAVARAGALTLAELAAAGLGAVLVPYPHAVDDHQYRNARHFAAAGAAQVFRQHTLDAQSLGDRLCELLVDRAGLLRMAEAARALAQPDAAERVADEVSITVMMRWA